MITRRAAPQTELRLRRILATTPKVYAVFHGKARVTESGADEPIDEFAKRFRGADTYPLPQPGEKGLIAQVSVDWIGGFGPRMQSWS